MELQRRQEEKQNALEVAERKHLFQLLSFLDRQPPRYYGIHMLVRAALLTDNSEYRVYFRRAIICSEEDEYFVIVGTRNISLKNSDEGPAQKCWIVSTWILDKDEEHLPKVFNAINEIDWLNDGLFVYCATSEPHSAVAGFLNSKRRGLETNVLPHIPYHRFILPVKDALNFQLSCPVNVYVKSLECCHAQLIYDLWSLKSISSVETVAMGIDHLPSAGVFLKENDELVSWAMCNPPGGISRLYTMENHRQRGYAKLAVQYLSKRMAQSGFFPFGHILVDNVVSQKFFQSLGFVLGCSCHDYLVHPNTSV